MSVRLSIYSFILVLCATASYAKGIDGPNHPSLAQRTFETEGSKPTLPVQSIAHSKSYIRPRSALVIAQNNSPTRYSYVSADEVHQLFDSGAYADLENYARYSREEKQRVLSGEWALGFFYYESTSRCGAMSPEQEEEFLNRMDSWSKEFPGSVTWRIVLASGLTRFAWRERGTGFASTVSEEGWQGFRRYLRRAWSILEEAKALETKDPHLYVISINAAMGLGGDMEEEFREGVAIESNYYPLYYVRTHTLLPRWFGQPGDVERFADRAVEITRGEDGKGMYARIASHLLRFDKTHRYFDKFDLSWKEIRRGYEDILSRFPDSNYRMNHFCLMACMYEKRALAASLFARIGEAWDRDVWNGEGRFERWKEWALKRGDYPGSGKLELAVEEGDVRAVNALVDHGAKLNRVNEYGRTVLTLAVRKESVTMAEYLLDLGADPNVAGSDVDTALHVAARSGNSDLARLLIERGAALEPRLARGWTPLHLAVYGGETDMVKLLLEKGARRNLPLDNGTLPLAMAAARGHTATEEVLRAYGATIQDDFLDDFVGQVISDKKGNLVGDTGRVFMDIVETRVGTRGSRYEFTVVVAEPFPLAGDMVKGMRVDFIWFIDIDQDRETGQSNQGNDYNIHLWLDEQGWHSEFFKVSPLSAADGVVVNRNDFWVRSGTDAASIIFPDSYLPSSSFDWWLVSTSDNAPDWIPRTHNPGTERAAFIRSQTEGEI